MQAIHRMSYRAVPVPSPEQIDDQIADQIARLIDGQARTGLGVTPHRPGQEDPAPAHPLIWIEGDGTGAEACRGVLVVAHGACLAEKEWSCVISHPSQAVDRGEFLHHVSAGLASMGWLQLTHPHPGAAGDHAVIAALVNRDLPGPERRLWLAAPSVVRQDAVPATAPGSRDQVETWVNEGGAGDDVPE